MSFEEFMRSELGPNWNVAVTEHAIDFYRRLYEVAYLEGIKVATKRINDMNALKRMTGK